MKTKHSDPQRQRHCPQCGAELPANTPPERCPKCLLKAGIGAAHPPDLATTSPSGVSRGLPQPGETLGHYAIARLLGKGGMGAVFEAQDLENGRRVALKVLSQSLEAPEDRQRFLREGRLAASLNHPNSVYVFGTEEIAGTPVISMELVAGGTLHERVATRGPLPPSEAVDAILQIIAGLEAAQRVGILHRDVKPSNCFVAPDGTVKVGDFGLSISTAVRVEPALTANGAFLGTPAFCSPEQLRGEELSARSDLYSVGATLFYLLTGRTPFEAKNVVQLLATVLEQRPISPDKLRPGIPSGLARVVLRCLEKDPGQRYRNYQELARALAPYTSVAPTPATLGLRLLAGIIDMLLLVVAGNVAFLLCFGSPLKALELAWQPGGIGLLWFCLWTLFGLLYYALPEGLWGATAGKAIMALRTTRLDRTPPGLPRAVVRAMIYLFVPSAPYCVLFSGLLGSPFQFFESGMSQLGWSLGFYVLLAGLFCTVRKHNGYAAVQDLVTGTRVISRAALVARPTLEQPTAPPGSVENQPVLGPYHILETLEQTPGYTWLLGYDLRLLRKVWIRQVPANSPPVPAAIRNVGRAGRLRWLNAIRSETENWDAFEGPTGQPLVKVAQEPQSWKQLRFWLDDLAGELQAAGADESLPEVLALDRVWITGEGRAKLLDFPAPGANQSAAIHSGAAPSSPASVVDPREFLALVGAVALSGSAATGEGTPALPIAIHARKFLENIPRLPDLRAVRLALKPLLTRAAEVSRLRRAAVVAGCVTVPLIAVAGMFAAGAVLKKWNETQPGLLDLNTVLQHRSAMGVWAPRNQRPNDDVFGTYIATHYADLVTNHAIFDGPMALSLIQGNSRRFAVESVKRYASATPEQVAAAEKALAGIPKGLDFTDMKTRSWMPFMIFTSAIACYVAFPAFLAALFFRGGLVLLTAGVTFVNRKGAKASRLRLLWRWVLTWCPMVTGIILVAYAYKSIGIVGASTFGLTLWAAVTTLSLLLPQRGLQDRLAGTWPVPR